jgi:D-glycero-beta-D-manno-heptose-7-phosphate kinase
MTSDASFARALATMHGRRAVLIGDLVLDSYVYGETVRVSREAPVLVVRKERVEHRLGGAANTAANLAALGVSTSVVGLVGEQGGTIREMLAAAGVNVEHVRATPLTTPVKTRVLAGAFGTSRQQVLRIDEEPKGELPAALQSALAEDLLSLGRHAEVVVVSEYGYGLAGEPVLAAVRELQRLGVPVCVDSRYALSSFAGVTAITPNVPEAEALTGMAIDGPQAAARAGAMALERLGCSACLLTQGRGGMTLFRPGATAAHVDIVGEDEVVDVTGAGDTVIATFSAAVAAGLGMENAMRLANVAAGVVVTKLGTATASPSEIVESGTRYGVELLPWDA